MTDTRGIFNERHRNWTWLKYDYSYDLCENCKEKGADDVDVNLEFLLRFRIRNLLQTEDDNFDRLFSKYEGIEFTLPTSYYSIDFDTEEEIINHFLKYKLTLGVGIRVPEFSEKVNSTLKQHFFIPILSWGKMWQIIFRNKFAKRDVVTKEEWLAFKLSPLKCLFCYNYPFGLYPGNFIVNQNILYMKMFIWMDKNRLHIHRKQKRVIMYKGSKIISWPFLSEAVTSLKEQKSINHLGNMAIFTPGEIFTQFIDIVINKIRIVEKQNMIIGKIQKFRSQPQGITKADLCLMYRNCRKQKKYNIDSRGNIIGVRKKNTTTTNYDKTRQEEMIEECIVSFISFNNNNNNNITLAMLDWFKYPKTKINVDSGIMEIVQMINRGEIDAAITQTSVLNKEYTPVNEALDNNIQTRPNVDVHRTGRFNRNADTNYYTNLCGIACGIQKVLPRDSKTVEPKHITCSEIGFIDILNTPDSPRNCGLVLETVLDVIVASFGMTMGDGILVDWLRLLISPDVRVVENPEAIQSLKDLDDKQNVYVCANQTLCVFPRCIPIALTRDDKEYLETHYGLFNYFRMSQYILKRTIPCVELLRESDNFWVCTSTPRTMYKVHVDGLLYTTREMETFERDPDQVGRLLKNSGDNNFIDMWVGDELRSRMINIIGPSVRCTPRPNIHHLPRVSHSCSSAKHAVGIVNNTRMIGSLHQKNIIASYYEQSWDRIHQPGLFPIILIAGGFNNQEDGIVVRKSSIERGLFMGNAYETAALKINYTDDNNYATRPITFTQTVRVGQILRRGQQIGWFKNISATAKLVENFSPEIDLEWIDANGGRVNKKISHSTQFLLSVVWEGKRDRDAERDEKEAIYRCRAVDVADIKHMNQIKLHVIYGYEFQPTVGDKLQTPTSQKGVITQLLTDEDTPYLRIEDECYKPDIIINPHFLKRQSLDVIELTGRGLRIAQDGRNNNEKSQYMERCFSFTVKDAECNMELGERLFTGTLMNPITGLPYLQPVTNPIPGKKYYFPPSNEFVDEDGFACVDKSMALINPQTPPHEIVIGSLYVGNYFCVNNHNTTIFYSKYGDNVVKTEFTGTPVRGKRGGFSTGPQEHLSLSAMGVENFKYDITHLRSDFTHVVMRNQNDPNREEIVPASSTFLRGNDDFNMRELGVSYGLKVQTFCKQIT